MYTEVSTSDQRCPVYEQQPAIGVPLYAESQPVFPPSVHTSIPWSTGLCDSSNCSLCCVSCWLPCITFGQIAEIIDEGSISCMTHAVVYAMVNYLTGCGCVYSGFYRAKIRQQYGLEESPCNDYCIHCCCHPCALCQEYRELEHHGFDLSVGWNGNIQQKIREEVELVQSAPTMQADMHREGV